MARGSGIAPAGIALVVLLAGGCYTGSARDVAPTALTDPNWLIVRDIAPVMQRGPDDCGPAVLTTVLRYWGSSVSLESVTRETEGDPAQGVRATTLRDAARAHGLDAFLIEGSTDDLIAQLARRRPIIVGLVKQAGARAYTHYEVVVGINLTQGRVVTLDPDRGWRENDLDAFEHEWAPSQHAALLIMQLLPKS